MYISDQNIIEDVPACDIIVKITIIICSRKPERCKKTLDDISKTIGESYETIVFDNREQNWGICKVYNYCAEKANSPYLCFMHEDFFIETKNWGKDIIDFIEKTPDCGVIGFAGGLRAGKNFSSWWAGENIMNINDGLIEKGDVHCKCNYKNHHYINPKNEVFSEVLCIDGAFQFVKKSIWAEIKYDEENFNGFHLYDVDFSFAAAQIYKNYVFLNMNIFHDSPGSINIEYIENMFIFQNKWNKKLPCYLNFSLIKISKLKKIRDEFKELISIYNLCKNHKYSIKYFNIQIIKINSIYFIPIFYFYYIIKKITKKIINILEIF
jgi:hypothetical protein